MGIRFRCHHCEHELHVKDFQGGKRGRCPECKGKFRIPLRDAEHSLEPDQSPVAAEQPTLTAPATTLKKQPGASPAVTPTRPTTTAASHTTSSHKTANQGPTQQAAATSDLAAQRGAAQSLPDASPANSSPAAPSLPAPSVATTAPAQPQALSDAPQAKWFVRPPSGGQYGPAPSESMWQWLCENRIGRDSLVWCEGWPEWLVASQVFADYFAAHQGAPSSPPSLPAGSAPVSAAAPDGTIPPAATSPQPIPLSDRNRATRKQRQRRNYTVMIAILSVIMIALVVALVVVLNSQQAAA